MEEQDPLERWVFPYLREPALWPVALALLAHVWVLVALALLAAWRSGTPFGWFPVVALCIATVGLADWERRTRGGLGLLAATVVSCWVLGALLGAVTGYLGVF